MVLLLRGDDREPWLDGPVVARPCSAHQFLYFAGLVRHRNAATCRWATPTSLWIAEGSNSPADGGNEVTVVTGSPSIRRSVRRTIFAGLDVSSRRPASALWDDTGRLFVKVKVGWRTRSVVDGTGEPSLSRLLNWIEAGPLAMAVQRLAEAELLGGLLTRHMQGGADQRRTATMRAASRR